MDNAILRHEEDAAQRRDIGDGVTVDDDHVGGLTHLERAGQFGQPGVDRTVPSSREQRASRREPDRHHLDHLFDESVVRVVRGSRIGSTAMFRAAVEAGMNIAAGTDARNMAVLRSASVFALSTIQDGMPPLSPSETMPCTADSVGTR